MGQFGIIVAAALATYAIRLAGFALAGRAVPHLLERFLAYVPVAVFAALIAPDLGFGDPQWLARGLGLVASALVAWRTRRLWAGLAVGMGVFWVVKVVG